MSYYEYYLENLGSFVNLGVIGKAKRHQRKCHCNNYHLHH